MFVRFLTYLHHPTYRLTPVEIYAALLNNPRRVVVTLLNITHFICATLFSSSVKITSDLRGCVSPSLHFHRLWRAPHTHT